MKIMGGVALGLIGLGLLLFFNQPPEHQPAKVTGTENVLDVTPEIYDYGTISMKDGKVKTAFTLKNPGTEALSLSKMYTTCMCTEATLLINGKSEGPFGMQGHGAIPTFSQTLQPNQEAQVEVMYDPNAHGPSGVGRIERSIIIEGQGGTLATFNIKANVAP